jgi:hypothetical protein
MHLSSKFGDGCLASDMSVRLDHAIEACVLDRFVRTDQFLAARRISDTICVHFYPFASGIKHGNDSFFQLVHMCLPLSQR